MRWSDLADDPDRLAIELSKLRIGPRVLRRDIRDVPELRERCELLSSPARLRLALEHFGDQGNPQPPRAERTEWHLYGRTLDWGRLPRLSADEASEAAGPLALEPRLPLPNASQLNSFTHAKLEKAVKSFGGEGTRGDVERDANLPPHDARRIRLMVGARLLRLNAAGRLVVDERVARVRARYVLRYLDESGKRWLDPNVELRGR